MRYSFIAAAFVSAAQALPTIPAIENSPTKSLQGTTLSYTLGDVGHIPYRTIDNKRRSWDDEIDRLWNRVDSIIGKIPKESQSEVLSRFWQVGVKDEKGDFHPAWEERASGKIIPDADLEKEIQRAFDEYTKSNAKLEATAGGSSLNNQKDTHGNEEKSICEACYSSFVRRARHTDALLVTKDTMHISLRERGCSGWTRSTSPCSMHSRNLHSRSRVSVADSCRGRETGMRYNPQPKVPPASRLAPGASAETVVLLPSQELK